MNKLIRLGASGLPYYLAGTPPVCVSDINMVLGARTKTKTKTSFATENLRYLVTNVKIDAVERTLHPLIATHTTLLI